MTEQTKDVLIEGTNWKLTQSSYGDWQPVEYREVHETIKGVKTGKTSWKWKKSEHYFPNPVQALRWIVRQDLVGGVEVTMDQYIQRWEELMDKYLEGYGGRL